MAILNCGFYAHGLRKASRVLIFLPDVAVPKAILWLLHSAGGACGDWLRNTNVERYAQTAGVALILPSSDRCNFKDPTAPEVSYLGDALPSFLKKLVLPLGEPMPNLIAGAGTGTAGAEHLAKVYPDYFHCAAHLTADMDWDALDVELRHLLLNIS